MLVIGGGAAGMMCAITAARGGAKVRVLERNDKIGRKLYITGKGRCNVTNLSFGEEFMSNILANARFLYSSLSQFDSQSTYDFFENLGVPLKVERGNRVFPVSDKSGDIVDALYNAARKEKVELCFGTRVLGVRKKDDLFVVDTDHGQYIDKVLVIATGGISYPATGSTGDGYTFATELGHRLVEPVPALVGLKCEGTAPYSGLSLKNVRLSIMRDGHEIAADFGEMLYTHTGLSGPIVLSLSSRINRLPIWDLQAVLDLKPAVSVDQLDQRLLADFAANTNKQLANVVKGYLPKALVQDWIARAQVDPNKACNAVTKEERARLAAGLKHMSYSILGLEPIEGAVVTAGGVDVHDVNPKTMESKLCPALFFAGEVLDIDALTGGYNLQLAFSTGYCAGKAAAAKENEIC